MGYYYRKRFYANSYKNDDGEWSFGIGICHLEDETYLYISFYKWVITIGYVYECEVRR